MNSTRPNKLNICKQRLTKQRKAGMKEQSLCMPHHVRTGRMAHGATFIPAWGRGVSDRKAGMASPEWSERQRWHHESSSTEAGCGRESKLFQWRLRQKLHRQLRWIPPTAGVQMIGIDHRLTPSSPHVGLCNRLPITRATTCGGKESFNDRRTLLAGDRSSSLEFES